MSSLDRMTETPTLTDFLLARIAEDEQWARYVAGPDYGEPHDVGAPGHHARVLAECEAKRRIVEEEHCDGRSGDHVPPFCQTCSDDEHLVDLPCRTLQLLALPYADHPDYREEWALSPP